MYEIKITAPSPGALHAALQGLVALTQPVKAPETLDDVPTTEDRKEFAESHKEEKEVKKEEGKKRGRPAKTETVEETKTETVAETPEVETPTAVSFTKEEITAKLQKVVEEKSLVKAKEILAKYNTKNISGITESQRAQFMADCEAALAGE